MKHILIIVVLLAAVSCFASDIYFDQATHGANDGTSCVNARAYSSMAAGDWTAGNVLHVCGTGTATGNTTAITAQGSGSSGNVITLKFETGAVLSSPQWSGSGGIVVNGKSFILIDGGTNGVIQNTNNGTINVGLCTAGTGTGGTCGVSANSIGVNIVGASSNIEVKNLTVSNIYVRGGVSDNSSIGLGIAFGAGGGNNAHGSTINIHNNVVHSAYSDISATFDGNTTSLHVYNNTLTDSCHHIGMGDSATNTFSDILIYGNDITNWDKWVSPAGGCHTDGIIIFANSGSTMPVSVYNNYIHGDIQPTNSADASPTAFIFCTFGSASPGAVCTVYNNLLVNLGDAQDPSGHNNILMWFETGSTGNQIYNNTLVGLNNGSGTAIRLQTTSTAATVKNNIITGFNLAFDSYDNPTTQLTANNNDYPGFTNGGNFYATNIGGSPGFFTLTQWLAAGEDATHSVASANLDASYKLQSGSSAIGLGANLTSLGITALDSDKAGVARPGGATAWDDGAYQFVPPPSVGVSMVGNIIVLGNTGAR